MSREQAEKPKFSTYQVVFIAMMAAIIYVLTLFRFPLGGSKVHFANAACLLAGLLFGPVSGGLAAGIGSGLFDLLNGYGIDEALITLISKFLMAAICAWIAGAHRAEGCTALAEASKSVRTLYAAVWKNSPRIMVGSAVGALGYVALYMLKHFVYQFLLYQNTLAGAFLVMGTKLPASMINAVFAMMVAPLLYAALLPAMKRSGVLKKL